jgi:hypothetical protein
MSASFVLELGGIVARVGDVAQVSIGVGVRFGNLRSYIGYCKRTGQTTAFGVQFCTGCVCKIDLIWAIKEEETVKMWMANQCHIQYPFRS